MLEKQLMGLKEDMNNSIFKNLAFDHKQRSVVLNKLDRKNKHPFNIKIILSSSFSVLIFCVLLLSTIQIKDKNLIGRDSGSQFFPFELNEQLITDAKEGRFSPVPSVTYGMSLVEVKELLGEPNMIEMPSEIDTVFSYDDFYLLFIEDELKFICISDFGNINKEDLISFFGRPDYENYNEELGVGVVTFSVGRWNFNFFIDIQDKSTIRSLQFSRDVIRY
ncbi:hypothetical protein [Sporosarcina sp. UB5]|uniref:hypothetical protein n=1 Tax=Sporosarcina sp. UB5 TaxID=3047463 RepID=UPI003D78D80E